VYIVNVEFREGLGALGMLAGGISIKGAVSKALTSSDFAERVSKFVFEQLKNVKDRSA